MVDEAEKSGKNTSYSNSQFIPSCLSCKVKFDFIWEKGEGELKSCAENKIVILGLPAFRALQEILSYLLQIG